IAPDDVLDLVFTVLVSSLVGVRLFYVLTHLGTFQPWYRAFFIWDGGLTLYGGIVLATLAVIWQARRRQVAFLDIADVFSPGVALGIGITRIGCFMAGCCYGKPCTTGLGVHFPEGAPAWHQFGAVAVHPSQLYASAAGFAVFGLLLVLEKVRPVRGATFGRFLVLYGLARFLEDFSRYYEPGQRMAFGWSNNQWISMAVAAVGVAVLAKVCGPGARKAA
ncbi:MAG TPA: prolipoprotein diacylglyceryl transferase, partial [Candidatus Krumholzibacteria bacterium]|nr:prolipoprotein diacylglyceryl transferase [Candidatus Krumholzibacteria bacterium]